MPGYAALTPTYEGARGGLVRGVSGYAALTRLANLPDLRLRLRPLQHCRHPVQMAHALKQRL